MFDIMRLELSPDEGDTGDSIDIDVSDLGSDDKGDEDTGGDEKANLITVDGKEYSETEIKDGMLRQSDYTTKMTGISDQRKQLDDQLQGVTILKDIVDRMESDPDGALADFNTIISDFKRKGGGDGTGTTDVKTRNALNSIQEELEDMRLERTIGRLKDGDKTFAENEHDILDYAHRNGIVDVGIAYNAWRGENFDKLSKPDKKGAAAKKADATIEGAKGGAGKSEAGKFKVNEGESMSSAFDRYRKNVS